MRRTPELHQDPYFLRFLKWIFKVMVRIVYGNPLYPGVPRISDLDHNSVLQHTLLVLKCL